MQNSMSNPDYTILPLPLMLQQSVTAQQKETEQEIPENSRQCPICHAYYKYGNSYWQHVRYVHASFLIQCVICEKCYKRTTMAKHHILHSHKIAWHLCGNYIRRIKKTDLNARPKNGIDKKTNLKYFRKKTLHLISRFNCFHCPEFFPTIIDLFQHVRIHRGELYDEYEDMEEEEEEEDEVEKEEEINKNTQKTYENEKKSEMKINNDVEEKVSNKKTEKQGSKADKNEIEEILCNEKESQEGKEEDDGDEDEENDNEEEKDEEMINKREKGEEEEEEEEEEDDDDDDDEDIIGEDI